MVLEKDSCYISGLTHMASSCSHGIGPSYVDATCFKRKGYLSSFADYYHVSIQENDLEEVSYSFEEFLKALFADDDRHLIDGLSHWIGMEVGQLKKVFTIKEESSSLLTSLGGEEKGYAPFYFVEDLFFVEFEKMVICFLIGNDE